MLKRLAILTVLFFVANVGLPSLGETPNAKADPNASEAQNAPSQRPATFTTSAIPQPSNSPALDSNSNQKANKDGWDKAGVLSNYLLAIIGIGGIVVALRTLRKLERQTKATEDAADAARGALITTQRPKLHVKRISLIPGKLIDVNGTLTIQDDTRWRIACVIANLGGSRARIVGSNLTINRLGVGTLKDLLPSLPAYGADYSFEEFSIESGERQEKTVVLTQQPDTSQFRILREMFSSRQNTSTSPLICFGFFHYRDESGVERRTGFGAQYDPEDMSFARLDSSEYEYCD